MSILKNETTKDTRMNCLLGFSRGNIKASYDDVQVNKVDIIDSVVASIDSIEAITFEKVKQKVQ